MDSSEYQVTIKSANQKVADYVLKCRSSWTVYRLKLHISETHICKPTVEEQRLIYAGNLLKDTLILKQIFFRDSLCTELTNSNKTDFTIHLVCSTSRSVPNDAERANQNHATASSPSVLPSSSSSGTASSVNHSRENPPNRTNEVRNTSASNTQATTQSVQSPAIPSMSSQAEVLQNLMQSDHMRQQLAVFQQLACVVAAQLAHNLSNNNINIGNITTTNNPPVGRVSSFAPVINGQALNIHVSTSSNITNHITVPQVIYAGNRPQTQLVAPNTREPIAGVHQNENINIENNPNGPVGEPDAFNFGEQIPAQAPVADQPAPPQPDQDVALLQHDVIDWVYYSIRAIVLMAALYIHASMFRLLFLVGLLAVAYFFNRRSARRPVVTAARAMANPRQQVPIQDGNQPRQNANRGDMVAGAVDGDLTGEIQQGRAQNAAAPNRVPFLKLCYLVVTDFLASLVPE